MRSLVVAGLLGLGTLGLTAVPAQASWLSQLLHGQPLTNNGGYSNYYDPYAAQYGYADPNAYSYAPSTVPDAALPAYPPQYAPASVYAAPVYSAPVAVPYLVYGSGYGSRYWRHYQRNGHHHH